MRSYRVAVTLFLALPACGRVGVELQPLQDGVGLGDGGPGDGGVCELDSDGDGSSDCTDECPSDPAKTTAGVCGCLASEDDSDGDGTPDCVDSCNGVDDASYVPDSSCGTGYCLTTNAPSTCNDGVETACMPGAPLSADDATCDGVDDNCDGRDGEDYPGASTTCGVGACARTGQIVCMGGELVDTCAPGAPTATVDDATWPGNGVDDDCDGEVDEDSIPPCTDTTPRTFEQGAHSLTVPEGCTTMSVQLWGGGGGSGGESSVGETGTPGRGGAGGYASSTVAVGGGPIALRVGGGGAGCGAGGVNLDALYNGGQGRGASTNGSPGADGMVSGGGAGGAGGANAGDGGRGHFGGGGGGGGATAPWPPYPGTGGGGGAASVLHIAGVRVVTAGGGGGGGGANGSSVASRGGAGGEGCAGTGGRDNAGGGGGGGICEGATTQQGTDGAPFTGGASLPSGRAAGAPATDCRAGGAGYAIVTFGN